MSIPKIIHQVWVRPKNRGPSKPPSQWMNSWKEMHPDWEYRLWTDKNRPLLQNERTYSLSQEAFRRADILRYEILHRYGGVYLDADLLCLKPIDDLLNIKAKMWAVYENDKQNHGRVANGIIGCTKGNLDMKLLMDNVQHLPNTQAWIAVGPLYFTKMIKKHNFDIRILPSSSFLPYFHAEKPITKEDPRCKDSYALHFWGSTCGRYDQGR